MPTLAFPSLPDAQPTTTWLDLMDRDASNDTSNDPSSSASSSSSVSASSGASSAPSSSSSASSSGTSQKWKHFDCGTNVGHASKEFLDKSHALYTKKLTNAAPGGSYNYAAKRADFFAERDAAAAATSIAIDTYFHIVTTAASANAITQDMATKQMQTLNTVYNTFNVHFNLKNTSFTTNDAWAIGASDSDDLAMKNALRQGTYSSLNIYFQSDLDGGILGKCTLPAQITGYVPPSAYANDGCNVNANTMPGGNIDQYNQGQTAVHETGHWLGLLHVFEGYSCDASNVGDLIADTPQQSVSTDGCPTGPPAQDSCPGLPGVDSIHNTMDYSYDSCYQGFTTGQATRILTLWPQFRQNR